MASQTAPTAAVAPANGSVKLVEYERYIDAQLAKTRRHVRSVDLSGSLMLLLAGSLAFFLAVAVLDHWVVPGGLGFWLRLLLCLSYFGAVGYYAYRTVVPLAWRRINPVYAAQSIERSEPKLKNSLINFLLFRERRAALPSVVYEGLEEQAATNLSKAPVEGAVDRTQLIHIGYLLLGVLVVAAAYKLFSPKDPLASLGRVIVPWADIQAPTRVTIGDVLPGDVEAFRGRLVEVSASVQGLGSGQSARLLYSTVDGQIVDRPIEMHQTASSYRHAASLPEGQAGLEQDLLYRIVAGDAATRSYRLNVVAAPTLVASSVEYEFPRYTDLSPQRIAHLGDIKALEGTAVTVRALANQPIKEAWLDFECDGKPDLRMSATGEEASVRFTLALGEDRRTPEHSSYQLLLVTRSGHRNPQPQRYKIEVTPDVAPEVTFLSPRRDDVQLPVGRRLTWELSAVDPDFALKQVTLHATVGKRELVNKHLVSEPWRGQLTRKEPFDSKKLGLKAGDVVEYWAVAEDNKEPTANRTQTPRRRIQIVDPRDADPAQQAESAAGEDIENQPPEQNERENAGQDAADQPQDKQKDPQQGDNEGRGEQDKPQQGEAGKNGADEKAQGDKTKQGDKQGQQQQGDKADAQAGEQGKNEGAEGGGQAQQGKGAGEKKKGDKRGQAGQPTEGGQHGDSEDQADSPVPSDGTDDGSAIERILNHRQEKGGKPSEQSAGHKNATDGSNDNQAQRGEGSTAGDETGDKPSEDKSSGEKAQGEKGGAGKGATQAPEGAQQNPSAGKATDDKPPSAKSTAAKPEGTQEKPKTDDPQAGEGGQAIGKVGDEKQKKPDDAAKRPGAKGGDPEQVKGDSGDGDRGQNDAGSPTPQEKNAPRNKTTQAPPGKQRPGDEAQSPSKSKRQSDSTGGEAGDNSGGGREGGGQNANREGTGGAGRNTAADEGGEASQEQGTKDDGSKAGDGRETDQATGKAGTEKGAARTVNGTKAEGGQRNQDQQAPPGDSPASEAQSKPDSNQKQPPTAGQPGPGPQSTPGGGNTNPDNADPQPSPTVKTPVAEVNLDYARKATELALEHLKDQLKKDKPDPELLDRLGWSKGDLEQFVRRWEERRASASSDTAAGRELDEALRSLGLQQRGASVKGSASRDDRQRGLKESRRTAPPADYEEQTRAYTEGTARGAGSK